HAKMYCFICFFSSRRRHTSSDRDWSSDVCSSDLRADEVTKVRGMFVHPRQADEVVARVSGVQRHQVVVGREGHQDTLTLRVEVAPGTPADSVRAALEAAIRDVMKLRGSVDIMPEGTIPENAKKIDDQRKWD